MQSTEHLLKLVFTKQNNVVLSAGHSMELLYFSKSFFLSKSWRYCS